MADDLDAYIASLPPEEQAEIHALAAGPDEALQAPQEQPQDGAQGTCSWDDLLYLMTAGELGTKPRAL